MPRLEIKADGDDIAADKMLRMATLTLRLVKEIEKSICKEKGTKPSIRWRVDIMSGFSCGLIALRAENPKEVDACQEAIRDMVWKEATRRMKKEAPDA